MSCSTQDTKSGGATSVVLLPLAWILGEFWAVSQEPPRRMTATHQNGIFLARLVFVATSHSASELDQVLDEVLDAKPHALC